jgi:AraC-like DNA-binding protein
MNYKVYKPSSDLAAWIECYWIISCPSDYISREELMIPGGRVELMINLGTPVNFLSSAGKSFEMKNNMYILGQRNTYFKAVHLPGALMWGVRFKPGSFHPFCNGSTSFLLNEVAEAAEIFGTIDTNTCYGRLIAATGDDNKIQIIEAFLKRILHTKAIQDIEFPKMLNLIKTNYRETSLLEFCNDHKLYYKKLERQFLQYAGYTPKEFLNVRRFYRAVEMIYKTSNNLTDICHQLGYYDQSHFIKNFKSYTSLSPLKFVKGAHEIPKFLTKSPSV